MSKSHEMFYRYRCKFRGRLLGAIGIYQEFNELVDAPNRDAARLKLCDTHQDIHQLQIQFLGESSQFTLGTQPA